MLQPLLDDPPEVIPYAQGSWGPPEAEKLLNGYGGWRKPWIVPAAAPGQRTE